MEPASNETITTLQNHVDHLTGIVERINTLRKIPGLLLAPSSLTGTQLEQGLEQINDVNNVINNSTTQESLKLAAESSSKDSDSKDPDSSGVDARRESRKRRRPPTPTIESSRPSPSFIQNIFPPSSRDSALTVAELPSYVRGHNDTPSPIKLHIWTPTAFGSSPKHVPLQWLLSSEEVIIRARIEDVMYAYIRLDVDQSQPAGEESLRSGNLTVENVIAFGPTERKSPYSQSDFMVFQKLSQHLAWMIQAEPTVQLDSFVGLLAAYETLFVSQCTACHRLLSEEGHIPPVCRLWVPNRRGTKDVISPDGGYGRWEPRHRACFST